jgi:hypothetical protein
MKTIAERIEEARYKADLHVTHLRGKKVLSGDEEFETHNTVFYEEIKDIYTLYESEDYADFAEGFAEGRGFKLIEYDADIDKAEPAYIKIHDVSSEFLRLVLELAEEFKAQQVIDKVNGN